MSGPIYACIDCFSAFKSMKEFNEHENICRKGATKIRLKIRDYKQHGKEPEICLDCREQFDTRTRLETHIKENHRVKCSYCTYKTSGKTSLEKHLNIWHNTEYSCETCGEKIIGKIALKDHVKKQHTNFCDVCCKTLSSSASVKVHKWQVHGVGKLFSGNCTECGRKFNNKSHMKNHMLFVHERKRDHICDLCGGAFSTKPDLKQHKIAIHESIDFEYGLLPIGKVS